MDNKKFVGKEVLVKIDRPIGSKHPEFSFLYPVNYGFVPGTKAPDGEEIDAYVLLVKEPVQSFNGVCIAIVHRLDDNDDKLVVVPIGKKLNKAQISKEIEFQEKYFNSEITL